jgi:hypothetical protein
MKVFSAPDEVQKPVIDYTNFDSQAYEKAEADYIAALKDHLIKLGYTGPNTGAEFNIPFADGAARYMVAEHGRSLALVHLPLGDAWNVPEYMTRGLRRSEVLQRIKGGIR